MVEQISIDVKYENAQHAFGGGGGGLGKPSWRRFELS